MTNFEKWKEDLTLEDIAKLFDGLCGSFNCPAYECEEDCDEDGSFDCCYDKIMWWGSREADE